MKFNIDLSINSKQISISLPVIFYIACPLKVMRKLKPITADWVQVNPGQGSNIHIYGQFRAVQLT